jgi:hypothetical protein
VAGDDSRAATRRDWRQQLGSAMKMRRAVHHVMEPLVILHAVFSR